MNILMKQLVSRFNLRPYLSDINKPAYKSNI